MLPWSRFLFTFSQPLNVILVIVEKNRWLCTEVVHFLSSVSLFGWTEMRWLFRCEIVLNLLEQWLHTYGLACSWTVRTCLTKPSLNAKSLLQWEHLKGLDFSWTLRNCKNKSDWILRSRDRHDPYVFVEIGLPSSIKLIVKEENRERIATKTYMFVEILFRWIGFVTDWTFKRCRCGMWPPFMCLKTFHIWKSPFTSTKGTFMFKVRRVQRWLSRLIRVSFFRSLNKITDADFWMLWAGHDLTAVPYGLLILPCQTFFFMFRCNIFSCEVWWLLCVVARWIELVWNSISALYHSLTGCCCIASWMPSELLGDEKTVELVRVEYIKRGVINYLYRLLLSSLLLFILWSR